MRSGCVSRKNVKRVMTEIRALRISVYSILIMYILAIFSRVVSTQIPARFGIKTQIKMVITPKVRHPITPLVVDGQPLLEKVVMIVMIIMQLFIPGRQKYVMDLMITVTVRLMKV